MKASSYINSAFPSNGLADYHLVVRLCIYFYFSGTEETMKSEVKNTRKEVTVSCHLFSLFSSKQFYIKFILQYSSKDSRGWHLSYRPELLSSRWQSLQSCLKLKWDRNWSYLSSKIKSLCFFSVSVIHTLSPVLFFYLFLFHFLLTWHTAPLLCCAYSRWNPCKILCEML